ncbi:hypothetical protein EA26_03975 [Vibrio navarrensis]|uniref:Uncharacterized protein n=1 Tax=Vibrio navarrensis TaxID=29495 RepID=A0A099LTA1_9VIBR|nr:hypothetical protein EA26_03975 [Vibrio navarrensis]
MVAKQVAQRISAKATKPRHQHHRWKAHHLLCREDRGGNHQGLSGHRHANAFKKNTDDQGKIAVLFQKGLHGKKQLIELLQVRCPLGETLIFNSAVRVKNQRLRHRQAGN